MTPGRNISNKSRDKLRVCVVAGQFCPDGRRGEIEQWSLRLASILQAAGHDLTLLETDSTSGASEAFDDDGNALKIVELPQAATPLYSLSRPLAISYRIYEWLRDHDDFDLVHFPDRGGIGFYSVCGQRQGLMLRDAVTVVGLHGVTATQRGIRGVMLRHTSELEVDFIERRAAELANAVWSVSRRVLEWAQNRGWELPRSVNVWPYPAQIPANRPEPESRGTDLQEIVFLGGLNSPKSLLMFMDAIELVANALPGAFRVTIPGPFEWEGECSLQAVSERVKEWPIGCDLVRDWDHRTTLDYLQQPGRLAMIVSLVQPPWSRVIDCLSHSVPFLVADVGGVPEVISPESRDRVVFRPNAKDLGEKLLSAIHGKRPNTNTSYNAASSHAEWVAWHQELIANTRRERALQASAKPSPTISLCITHYNRPAYLRQALKSVVSQTQLPYEVIVVDDGSPANVHEELEAIERDFDFEGRGWRLERQENRYLGAARNRAAALASGDYILFMDDDNVAKPHEVATFAKVASHDCADVYTCLFDSFEGERSPLEHAPTDTRWLYPGAAQALSVLRNTFGDANALFRREALLAVGGFTEDYGVGHEDWEVFERLMFAGYRIEVIPEPLFYYRTSATSMVRTSSIWRNHLRSLRPHLNTLPEPYHDLIEMMSGQSVMHWVGSCRRQLVLPWSDGMPIEGDDDGSPVLKDALPLRYQIADAINARIKRLRRLHGIGKAVASHAIVLTRTLIKAVVPRRTAQCAINARPVNANRAPVTHGPHARDKGLNRATTERATP